MVLYSYGVVLSSFIGMIFCIFSTNLVRPWESKGTSTAKPHRKQGLNRAFSFYQARISCKRRCIGEENSFPHALSMEYLTYIYHKNQPRVGIQHGYLMDPMGWVVIHHPKCLDFLDTYMLCHLSALERKAMAVNMAQFESVLARFQLLEAYFPLKN